MNTKGKTEIIAHGTDGGGKLRSKEGSAGSPMVLSVGKTETWEVYVKKLKGQGQSPFAVVTLPLLEEQFRTVYQQGRADERERYEYNLTVIRERLISYNCGRHWLLMRMIDKALHQSTREKKGKI